MLDLGAKQKFKLLTLVEQRCQLDSALVRAGAGEQKTGRGYVMGLVRAGHNMRHFSYIIFHLHKNSVKKALLTSFFKLGE